MIEELNEEVLLDIKKFFTKINEKALYSFGIMPEYDSGGDPALALEVEYFHFSILLDDRMVYIMKNIVCEDYLSLENKICNTIISHFYGARGIHHILTRERDPKKAHVNFEILLHDADYRKQIQKNLDDAKALGLPIYGSTELRTSLYGASNTFVAKHFNQERNADTINILLWVASFIERGIIDRMKSASSLKELYGVISSLEGVGQYYGYHCSTSNSVNPAIKVQHDERFCVPGPGARATLDRLFENSSLDYGERVIYFRENYKTLIGDIYLHPSTHNIEVYGRKIFDEEQDELKTYGCEVGLCQYNVYHRFKSNPHLINRRKVARVNEEIMDHFFNGTSPSAKKIIFPVTSLTSKVSSASLF